MYKRTDARYAARLAELHESRERRRRSKDKRDNARTRKRQKLITAIINLQNQLLSIQE